MDDDEPGGEDVDDVMEVVGVAGTVESGIEGEHEEEDVGYISQPFAWLVICAQLFVASDGE